MPVSRNPASGLAPQSATAQKTGGVLNRRRVQPRRLPNQARGRDTIQTVLRATAAAIERDGLDRLTTRRIAAQAGISVGALYEYFPNKQAVVYALVADWLQRIFDVLDGLHPRHGASPDLIGYLNRQIDDVAQLYRNQPGLSALVRMISSVPELRDALRAHESRIEESVTSALLMYVPHADRPGARAGARTIATIAHAMLCEAVSSQADESERLMRNLKVCVFALATRLLLD